jgi:hypothetical protein
MCGLPMSLTALILFVRYAVILSRKRAVARRLDITVLWILHADEAGDVLGALRVPLGRRRNVSLLVNEPGLSAIGIIHWLRLGKLVVHLV